MNTVPPQHVMDTGPGLLPQTPKSADAEVPSVQCKVAQLLHRAAVFAYGHPWIVQNT